MILTATSERGGGSAAATLRTEVRAFSPPSVPSGVARVTAAALLPMLVLPPPEPTVTLIIELLLLLLLMLLMGHLVKDSRAR